MVRSYQLDWWKIDMWILIWLAMGTNRIEYYHIDNFSTKDACVKAMSEAAVLVTNKDQTVDCLWIKDLSKNG